MPTLGINAGFTLAGKALGARLDPYGAYNFLVEIEGIIAGGFNTVSGLDITTEVDTIREGGVNDFVHKLPKWTTKSYLILNNGKKYIFFLWNWYADVMAVKFKRKNGSIYLLDNQGLPAMWWDFIEAYPIKWSGPSLDSSTSLVAFESLTLTHHGLTKPAMSQALSAIRGAANLL